jgi:hypothetical protein
MITYSTFIAGRVIDRAQCPHKSGTDNRPTQSPVAGCTLPGHGSAGNARAPVERPWDQAIRTSIPRSFGFVSGDLGNVTVRTPSTNRADETSASMPEGRGNAPVQLPLPDPSNSRPISCRSGISGPREPVRAIAGSVSSREIPGLLPCSVILSSPLLRITSRA